MHAFHTSSRGDAVEGTGALTNPRSKRQARTRAFERSRSKNTLKTPAQSTPTTPDPDRPGDSREAPAQMRPRDDESVDALLPPAGASSGETVVDQRALRFRSLTLAEADLTALDAPGGFHNGFKIRVAKLSGRRREAGTLVERRYQGRGYTIPTMGSDPYLSTFIAYDEGVLVGTVGVRLDSEKGLSADDLYRAEIDGLRGEGAKFCEFTRLAVDKTAASKPVLAGLFHTAYLYCAVIRGCTHAVIEVNPRHVAFYSRALRFEPIGPERMNKTVDAPAVLLCASFATIADGLTRFAGRPHVPGAKSSLFVYGFPPDEEAGVLNRLRGLVAAT